MNARINATQLGEVLRSLPCATSALTPTVYLSRPGARPGEPLRLRYTQERFTVVRHVATYSTAAVVSNDTGEPGIRLNAKLFGELLAAFGEHAARWDGLDCPVDIVTAWHHPDQRPRRSGDVSTLELRGGVAGDFSASISQSYLDMVGRQIPSEAEAEDRKEPELLDTRPVSVELREFLNALRGLLPICRTADQDRENLAGVALVADMPPWSWLGIQEAPPQDLCMVATDGKRIGAFRLTADLSNWPTDKNGLVKSVLIPPAAAEQLLVVAEAASSGSLNGAGVVHVRLQPPANDGTLGNKGGECRADFVFENGDFLTSTVIVGRYPAVHQVFPKSIPPAGVSLRPQRALEALALWRPVGTDKSTRLFLDSAQATLTSKGYDNEVRVERSLNVEVLAGVGAGTVLLQHNFLVDALTTAAQHGEIARVCFNPDDLSPMLVTSEQEGWCSIMMPMRP